MTRYFSLDTTDATIFKICKCRIEKLTKALMYIFYGPSSINISLMDLAIYFKICIN